MADAPAPASQRSPVEEIRLGVIKAAIWKNDTEHGARYNVTFSRSYRDGDAWKSSDSFGRDDLLILAKVADQAHSWIAEQRGGSTAAGNDETRLTDKRLPRRSRPAREDGGD